MNYLDIEKTIKKFHQTLVRLEIEKRISTEEISLRSLRTDVINNFKGYRKIYVKTILPDSQNASIVTGKRSEERRVGKEC